MRPARTLGILFLVTLLVYLGAFAGIEHLRRRHGPWEITFFTESNPPALAIRQPRLGLQAVRLVFPDETWPPQPSATVRFDRARPAPFALPRGRCVFLDLTTLPGTVTLQLFQHEIQLLPRVLTIDHREHPWQSEMTLSVKPAS